LGKEGPFELANLGVSARGDLKQVASQAQKPADAGMTWWLELLLPEIYGVNLPDAVVLELMRERIRRGMPGI
jgi:hypothetical protein